VFTFLDFGFGSCYQEAKLSKMQVDGEILEFMGIGSVELPFNFTTVSIQMKGSLPAN
jgi:hypothetical protein